MPEAETFQLEGLVPHSVDVVVYVQVTPNVILNVGVEPTLELLMSVGSLKANCRRIILAPSPLPFRFDWSPVTHLPLPGWVVVVVVGCVVTVVGCVVVVVGWSGSGRWLRGGRSR